MEILFIILHEQKKFKIPLTQFIIKTYSSLTAKAKHYFSFIFYMQNEIEIYASSER